MRLENNKRSLLGCRSVFLHSSDFSTTPTPRRLDAPLLPEPCIKPPPLDSSVRVTLCPPLFVFVFFAVPYPISRFSVELSSVASAARSVAFSRSCSSFFPRSRVSLSAGSRSGWRSPIFSSAQIRGSAAVNSLFSRKMATVGMQNSRI
ncbi:hypothetical protein ZIOFF_025613 [Zingiber officinale]|uniref:Uncharacterized protein n=1 Tax=Zingiber officinale TaxID=94328 RepID=A0A8J5GVA2_ZINOF|nr:hypothetical protein ZIOFF_025613 [Zingiber officinale]